MSRVFASGWSQTGLFWSDFLRHGYHERARAIDGYLVAVAPGPEPRPDGAILVNLLSEAEVVRLLEAAPTFGGTTAKSGGIFWVPNNPFMRKQGIADAREDFLRHLAAVADACHAATGQS